MERFFVSFWYVKAKKIKIQFASRFNKIFGGFLMRQAFELAWANTYVYTRTRPMIQHMDDISFKKPVSVGALLYFNAQVRV